MFYQFFKFIIFLFFYNFKFAYSYDLYKQALLKEKIGDIQTARNLYYQYYTENKKKNIYPDKLSQALYKTALLTNDIRTIDFLEELLLKYPSFKEKNKALEICADFFFLKKSYSKAKYYYQKILLNQPSDILFKKALFYQIKIGLIYENKNFDFNFFNSLFKTHFVSEKAKYYYQKIRWYIAFSLFYKKDYQQVLRLYKTFNLRKNTKQENYLIFKSAYYLKKWDLAWDYAIYIFKNYPDTKEYQLIHNFFLLIKYKKIKELKQIYDLFYSKDFKSFLNKNYIYFQFASFIDKKNAEEFLIKLKKQYSFSFLIKKEKKKYNLILGPFFGKELDRYRDFFKKEKIYFFEKTMQFHYF